MTNNNALKGMAELLEVMAALRTPGSGCPWDLDQTFESIAPYTIEEAYEVADAIERGDKADLKEELGDLLLQVVYHARIAEEQQAFAFTDVAQAITAKMIRRHPHVFGTEEERAAGATKGFWERLKDKERAEKVAARRAAGQTPIAEQGVLATVSANMPALTRAVKLQNKAAKVGFDWPSLKPVLAKMREELAELDEAIAAGDDDHVREEFGDLLFVMANVARHLKLDPETSLREANAKFTRRFDGIEQELARRGRAITEATLEEMDAIWDDVKVAEQAKGNDPA